APAGRRRAPARPHLPDARTRLPRSGVGTRPLEGAGRDRRGDVDARGARSDGSAPCARPAAVPRPDRQRGGARRPRAARHRPARAVGLHVDPRPRVVSTSRIVSRDAGDSWVREGYGRLQRDAYHYLLDASWPKLIAILVGLYVTVNTLFAI